jgi:hypothetical protein
VVRVPGYRTEMHCASCEVRTEFICYVEKSSVQIQFNLFCSRNPFLAMQPPDIEEVSNYILT